MRLHSELLTAVMPQDLTLPLDIKETGNQRRRLRKCRTKCRSGYAKSRSGKRNSRNLMLRKDEE